MKKNIVTQHLDRATEEWFLAMIPRNSSLQWFPIMASCYDSIHCSVRQSFLLPGINAKLHLWTRAYVYMQPTPPLPNIFNRCQPRMKLQWAVCSSELQETAWCTTAHKMDSQWVEHKREWAHLALWGWTWHCVECNKLQQIAEWNWSRGFLIIRHSRKLLYRSFSFLTPSYSLLPAIFIFEYLKRSLNHQAFRYPHLTLSFSTSFRCVINTLGSNKIFQPHRSAATLRGTAHDLFKPVSLKPLISGMYVDLSPMTCGSQSVVKRVLTISYAE